MNVSSPLSIVPLGLSLSSFFVISFVLCVLYGLVAPDQGFHQSLMPMLLPGFTWLSWPSFFIGLAWSVVFGWYIAVIFVPLYNYFVAWSR
jgi:hypothetical protein